MKNEDNIKDLRSTGRRKARRALFKAFVEFKCADCGKTSIVPPKDAPPWFEEIWPEEQRVLDYSLQADHETKNLLSNDEADLSWRCASCHKLRDMQTEKGQSTTKEEFF